jgi:iron complex transport system substrate-binding protein
VRIVSLLPSATEIIADLGLGDALVGVSAECDHPAAAGLPVVSGSRVDTSVLRGAEIDRAVRAALADGRSLYAVDAELVEALEPDLIVTQDLCAVCAVSAGEVREACVGVETLSLDPHTLEEIQDSVLVAADRLGVRRRGEIVVDLMRARLARVRARVATRRSRRVFLAEWLDPPFASGHWLPELVAVAGGVDVLGRPGLPAVPTTWEAVAAARPELIVLAPCGYDAERAASEAAGLTLPAPAVPVDANAFFSRPSPRVAEGAEHLAEIFHAGRLAA